MAVQAPPKESKKDGKQAVATTAAVKEEQIDTTTINEVQVSDLIWGHL